MNPLFLGILVVLIPSLMTLVNSLLKEKRAGSEKYQNMQEEFLQRVNAMLDSDETVEAFCGYQPCAAITGRRLLVDTKAGIQAVAYDDIKALKGVTVSGDKTNDVERMWMIMIKADKKYTICNQSEGFAKVVESLKRHTGL